MNEIMAGSDLWNYQPLRWTTDGYQLENQESHQVKLASTLEWWKEKQETMG